MFEEVLLSYLKASLNVPVYMERPEDALPPFLLFEKTGGNRRNKLYSSVFAFQSYGNSLYQSALLNNRLKEVLDGLEAVPQVSSVRYNTDYNFTDVQRKEHRYQAVYEIFHY